MYCHCCAFVEDCPQVVDSNMFLFDPTTENRFIIVQQNDMDFEAAKTKCHDLCISGRTSRLASTEKLSKEYLMKIL